jgi:hypothetical protein
MEVLECYGSARLFYCKTRGHVKCFKCDRCGKEFHDK